MKTYRFLVEFSDGNEMYAYEQGYSVQDAQNEIWRRFSTAIAVTYKKCPYMERRSTNS